MQGQGDARGPLPEPLDIDHASGSGPMNHQLCWNNDLQGLSETQLPTFMLPLSTDSSIHSQQHWPGSSSSSSRPVIGLPECKMVNGWPSSVGFSGGTMQHLENHHQNANVGDFTLGGVDVHQLQLQHPNYRCNPPSLILDEGRNHDNSSIVCPGDQVSDVSGINRGERVGSSDVRHRRMPCKRKSLEGHIGQSSAVPVNFLSSSGAPLQQQAEPRPQPSHVIQEPATVSEHFPSSSVQGSAEDSRRNSLSRIISSHPTAFSSGIGFPNTVAASSRTSGFIPSNQSVDLHLLSMSSYIAAQRPPVVSNVPASAYSGNSSTSVFSGTTGSSAHYPAGSSRNTRNDLGHPVYVPMTGSIPLVQNSMTRSVPDASDALPGNAVFSSGNGLIPSIPPISQSAQSNAVPLDPIHRARYLQSRRLSEYVRRVLLASSGQVMGGESSQVLHGRGCPTAGLVNQGLRLSSSRSLPSIGRRADNAVGVPNSRHLTSLVDERRRRLVELRRAMEYIRGTPGIRIEDIMRLHPSAFLGIPNLHDRHRDLRLDVDNMSYEELLALEERIGNKSNLAAFVRRNMLAERMLGVLEDSTRVAVKNLLNNRGQAEKEFRVEVEAIGRVRHKNLVRLLGYCVEGAHRMLVYEYVDNGNLEQWLHGEVGPHSPLTWDIRMQIIAGTAKGLTYLHEGLEPKVVHRDIKSSNILLDQQWNPKVSDFGLAKLLGSEKSYVTTRVMGTFGYVAPEYASTGMLNERSDVYSFGILIMEIISGRSPVDYSRPPGEVNLVEWLKTMVTDRNAEGILDPRLTEKPSSRALKRALLVALRCVDPNAQKRPKMGHVVHMLEADEFPFRDERRSAREHGYSHRDILRNRLMDKRLNESGDSSGYESSIQSNISALRRQDPDEH
ncbi:hypothetical protein MLD38_034883 [Melastoma candidum]|uniref:Uncharacterized protein n=1 Tax=Melastoma candidum TaxID=119954 RepID=A0ACB9MC08_9MYRT|nr:hypothetical protein MLD38_034883 [Melastoma candidum]